MIEYASDLVMQYVKQYNMLLNSLKYIEEEEVKKAVYYQMNKIEESIINSTNEVYEKEYLEELDRETKLLSEEKEKLNNLIDLINNRRNYITERNKEHRKYTGINMEIIPILGENKIEEYQDKLDIINKYLSNIKLIEKINTDNKYIENKIVLAKEKIAINNALNKELEKKLISYLNNIFKELDLYNFTTQANEIDLSYSELEYAYNLANDNLEFATKKHPQSIVECQSMLNNIEQDYEKIKEKKYILELIGIYNKEVIGYKELLNKRNKINDILKNILSSKLYSTIIKEIDKQYNTIKLELQDVNSYKILTEELEDNKQKLIDIDNENNSEKFKNLLEVYIENEKQYQKEMIELKKKQEYEERQREILKEQERQISYLKKQQKLAEEIKQPITQTINKKDPAIENKEVVPKEGPKIEVKNTEDIFASKENIIPIELKEEKIFTDAKNVKEIFSTAEKEDLVDKKIVETKTTKIPIIKNNKLTAHQVEVKEVEKKNKIEALDNTDLFKADIIFPDLK